MGGPREDGGAGNWLAPVKRKNKNLYLDSARQLGEKGREVRPLDVRNIVAQKKERG